MLISPAYAQTAGLSDPNGMLLQFAPFILIFVVMYFLLVRPQQQKAKAHKAAMAALRRGDMVLTSGGIIGKIVRVLNDQEVSVEIAENVRVRLMRLTITEVLAKTQPVGKDTGADADDDDATDGEAADAPVKSAVEPKRRRSTPRPPAAPKSP
ncbi:MAG TPA: preprotein translocase subunit YajC [Stellaceae bacterium]|nr:preprotein translocase subunit YajC [Stellaceae bacterium]